MNLKGTQVIILALLCTATRMVEADCKHFHKLPKVVLT